jgi:hypothetical protein
VGAGRGALQGRPARVVLPSIVLSSIALIPVRTGINGMKGHRDGGHFTRCGGHAHG